MAYAIPIQTSLLLRLSVVVGHLQAGPLEATLDIEALVGLGTV